MKTNQFVRTADHLQKEFKIKEAKRRSRSWKDWCDRASSQGYGRAHRWCRQAVRGKPHEVVDDEGQSSKKSRTDIGKDDYSKLSAILDKVGLLAKQAEEQSGGVQGELSRRHTQTTQASLSFSHPSPPYADASELGGDQRSQQVWAGYGT